MANDDKTVPRPRAPALGQSGQSPAAQTFGDDSDWERAVAAWDPSFSAETPPPMPLGPADPPSPDSTELVLDDVSSGEVLLQGHNGPNTPRPEVATAPILPRAQPGFYEDDPDPTVVVLPPGAAPVDPYPPGEDSSGVLLIPEIAELEAGPAAPPLARHAGNGAHASMGPTPEGAPATAPALRELGRELTDDGLPDVSVFFKDEPLPPADTAESLRHASSAGSAFEDSLPTEEPVRTLDLVIPMRASRPLQEIADAAAAFAGEGSSLLEVVELESQLNLLTEQLAALRSRTEPGAEVESVCRTAVAAGRTAERLGQPDAIRFYDQALAVRPDYAPALRGRLKLLVQSGALAEAQEAVATLARVLPDERDGYLLLLEHARVLEEGRLPDSGEAQAEPSSVGRLLLECERNLAGADRARAAASLERLAAILPGDLQSAVRTFAATLFEVSGRAGDAEHLRSQLPPADAVRGGLAALRTALRGQNEDALKEVLRTVEALPASSFGVPLLRWAARLARAQGQAGRSRALLEKAQGLDPLPLHEAVEVANTWPDSAPLEALLGRIESADPARAVLAGYHVATRLSRDGRISDALEVLRRTRKRGALAEPTVLGLVAEQSALAATAGEDRLQAWRLWEELDPARAPSAAVLRAQTLLRREETRADGLGVLEQAARMEGQGALFWWLSWHLRREGQVARAGATLAESAGIWSRPALERIALALRERAQELDLGARPENLIAYLPEGPLAPPTADDPARLTRELLTAGQEPRRMAEIFRSAAAEGSRLRILETVGWLIQAGAYGEALSWVQEKIPHPAHQPTISLLLRRLVGLIEDPSTAAAVLGELIIANAGAEEVPELEFRRGEALERAGRSREAAGEYRELMAGSLSRDAGLALRRVLWSLRDGEGLQALGRDEYDAHHAAGRTRGAAAALIETARIERDLRKNPETAQGLLSAARLIDPDRSEARVRLLLLPGARPTGAELVTLLEELARDLPAEAISVQFLAALIADGQGDFETAQRLLREALRRAGERPPLALVRRHVASEDNRVPPAPDLAALLQARAQSIAKTPGTDPRLGTSLFVRAAEVEEATGNRLRAEELYRRALEQEPDHLPALIRLRKLLVGRAAFAEAIDVIEAEARTLRRPTRRAKALVTGATLATQQLGDSIRARRLLERAIEADPRNDAAFLGLRKLLEEAGEIGGVAELLGRRLIGASPEDATALRLERVDLLLRNLGDRTAAKRELRALLEQDPDNANILGRLALMELEDEDYGASAELSIRQARFERDPAALEACFLRIGRLYITELDDPRVALGAYERVLRISPGSREALEALSDLYARQNDTRKAISVTERLVEGESDPERRLPFLVHLGHLWEAAGDNRRAGVMLRRAVDESPRNLQSIGELARFHERHRELAARNVLLDGAVSLLGSDLYESPENLTSLRTMVPILRWRQRDASAISAAQLLGRYGTDPMEIEEAASWLDGTVGGRRLAPLANPELDERALPRAVQGGVRHVLRLLGPALAAANRPDLRRWQVGRSARQRGGSDVRREFESVAADLGVRSFELYVSETDPRALAVEPADPAVIVIGADLVRQGPVALRFAAGWCLRLVETHFDLLLENSPTEAAALLAGVVRRFLPDYQYPELDDGVLAAADARVARALKSRHNDMAAFANEIAGSFSPNDLFLDAQETAARAGLLACGDIAAALDLISAAAGRPSSSLREALEIPVVARLVDFALSEDYEEIAQALEAIS